MFLFWPMLGTFQHLSIVWRSKKSVTLKKIMEGVRMRKVKQISLKWQIMGLLILPVVFLLPVFFTIYISGTNSLKDERNRTMHSADTIALDGAISKQRSVLDTQMTEVLNTDELAVFLTDRENTETRMIIEGMFLSLKEAKISRLTLYDSQRQIILQQSGDLPERTGAIPEELQASFTKAEQDFAFHYYFRGSDGVTEKLPVEYCIMTVATDLDDNVIGFVELALDSSVWLNQVAKLTGNPTLLYDSENRFITASTDANLSEQVASGLPDSLSDLSFLQLQTDKSSLLVDILPLKGAMDNTAGVLFVVNDSTALIEAERKQLIMGMTVTLAIVAVSQIIVLLVVGKAICNPIQRVTEFAAKLASGDLSSTLDIKNGGETGRMSMALNQMTESLNDGQGKMHENRKSMELQVRVQNEILDMVKESAGEVNESSLDFTVSTKNLSKLLESQASVVEQISQRIEEVAASSSENAEHASKATTITDKARNVAEDGNQKMQDLITAMGGISESSKKISHILEVLEDIAGQTNLLALNATIEAARAGEAGKGFAVVAQEVKDLAKRSSESVKETSVLLVESEQNVGNGSELANQTAKVLSEIVQSIDEVTQITEDISEASNIQADGIGEVKSGLHDVNAEIHEMTGLADKTASDASGLSELADNLATRLKLKLAEKDELHGAAHDIEPVEVDEAAWERKSSVVNKS
jgi:methyl-accepting chemotaxis protein